MPQAYASTVVDATAEDVWRVMGDFGKISDWHPAIATCKLAQHGAGDRVGSVRHLTLQDGAAIVERLVALDEAERSLTYVILEAPLPISRYRSVLRVSRITDGDRAFVEWSTTFDCDPDAAESLVGTLTTGIYEAGVQALKRHFADS